MVEKRFLLQAQFVHHKAMVDPHDGETPDVIDAILGNITDFALLWLAEQTRQATSERYRSRLSGVVPWHVQSQPTKMEHLSTSFPEKAPFPPFCLPAACRSADLVRLFAA